MALAVTSDIGAFLTYPDPTCPGITWQPVHGARTFLDSARHMHTAATVRSAMMRSI